jgi:ubiquinone/menaquinone biosynthesis C-methylase UbiE
MPPAVSMTEFSRQAIRQSGYLREGFADRYDAFRPAPPAVLLDALARYAGCSAPAARVVDLGSGTGLSTRAWADRAGEVVGIEPNPEMRKAADRLTGQRNVRYVEGFASDTGLEAASADVVTCSQSFHWMEREPVLAEAVRILRAGGVFAAYDYDFPPLIHPEVDAAFSAHLQLRGRYRDEHKVGAGWTRTPKSGHLAVIRESGLFAHTREFVVHDEREAGADEIVGFARSLGLVPELLALGVSEEDLGLTGLEETVHRVIGNRRVSSLWGYRARLGVKGV